MFWRALKSIESSVGASAVALVLPSTHPNTSCSAFWLQNTHASQDLHIAGEGADASTSSFKLAAGESRFFPFGFDKSNGPSIIGSGAATTFTAIPIG